MNRPPAVVRFFSSYWNSFTLFAQPLISSSRARALDEMATSPERRVLAAFLTAAALGGDGLGFLGWAGVDARAAALARAQSESASTRLGLTSRWQTHESGQSTPSDGAQLSRYCLTPLPLTGMGGGECEVVCMC